MEEKGERERGMVVLVLVVLVDWRREAMNALPLPLLRGGSREGHHYYYYIDTARDATCGQKKF